MSLGPRDSVTAAVDRYGEGPAVIFIGGAASYRAIDEATTQTARRLAAEGFTTVDYDRRGRGRSGDTQPWALAREVEDVAVGARSRSRGRRRADRGGRRHRGTVHELLRGRRRPGGRQRWHRCHRARPVRAAVLRRPQPQRAARR